MPRTQVSTDMLKDLAVTAAKLAANAVTTDKVSDGTLTLAKLAAAVVALFPTTGDERLTWKAVADAGWIMLNDGTIGNAASGATTRANADTEALYTLWWNNCADAQCPVSTGRGANAAADFAANKTLKTPLALGRVLAIAGAGAGLTSRVLGLATGAETHTLTEAELPSTPIQVGILDQDGAGAAHTTKVAAAKANATALGTNTVDTIGSGSAHPNIQPSGFRNVMVKL